MEKDQINNTIVLELNLTKCILQETRFALMMNLGGVVSHFGALFPVIKGTTTVLTSPQYDKDLMVNAFHDEKYV